MANLQASTHPSLFFVYSAQGEESGNARNLSRTLALCDNTQEYQMNVQVNTQAATSRIKNFIKAHGGDAKHSEVLELVAGICGFDSYRAMKAVSETAACTSPILGQVRGRQLEDPQCVVYKTTAVDWQLAGNPEIGFEDLPANHRTKYDVVFEQYGDQFRILVKPEGVDVDTFDGRAVLDMMLEIDNGVPCVHMTNDPADAVLVSVFSTEQGLLVRPDDGEWMRADQYEVPAVLNQLANKVCNPAELDGAYVSLLDTAKKYKDDTVVVAPAVKVQVVSAVTPVLAPAPSPLPHARTALVQPVKRKHVGAAVEVTFDRSNDEAGLHLWVDVNLLDVEGVVGDADHVGGMSHYGIGAAPHELHQMAGKLAELIAFFVEGGYSMSELTVFITAILKTDAPHLLVETLVNLVFDAETKQGAYDDVLLKLLSV
jgi:hypothetical protein